MLRSRAVTRPLVPLSGCARPDLECRACWARLRFKFEPHDRLQATSRIDDEVRDSSCNPLHAQKTFKVQAHFRINKKYYSWSIQNRTSSLLSTKQQQPLCNKPHHLFEYSKLRICSRKSRQTHILNSTWSFSEAFDRVNLSRSHNISPSRQKSPTTGTKNPTLSSQPSHDVDRRDHRDHPCGGEPRGSRVGDRRALHPRLAPPARAATLLLQLLPLNAPTTSVGMCLL
ncbi:hypothetical protein GGS26DRAFT_249359 [Hypomontagnella submonticulosa]|nr:hypothetical protein GGS26DRAFT_249359 [Hypomontagnella submonticulosa]